MTPEAINQAMAELDGWKLIHGQQWKDGYGSIILPPNYTEDLNAVARVAPKLSQVGHIAYTISLYMICVNSGYAPLDATALQRCEAILRAVGRWVE